MCDGKGNTCNDLCGVPCKGCDNATPRNKGEPGVGCTSQVAKDNNCLSQTCWGCDKVPNSGKVPNYCGLCENTTKGSRLQECADLGLTPVCTICNN